MTYTVTWLPEVEQLLAEWWVDNPALRNSITSAADTIDKLLQRAPYDSGVHSFDNVYSLAVVPLGVDYEIDDGDRKVIVLSVWMLPDGSVNGAP